MFNWLNRKKNTGEITSLKQYRYERGAAQVAYRNEKDEAKHELDIAIQVPMAIYRQRMDAARREMMRVEEELWQEHLARINNADTTEV